MPEQPTGSDTNTAATMRVSNTGITSSAPPSDPAARRALRDLEAQITRLRELIDRTAAFPEMGASALLPTLREVTERVAELPDMPETLAGTDVYASALQELQAQVGVMRELLERVPRDHSPGLSGLAEADRLAHHLERHLATRGRDERKSARAVGSITVSIYLADEPVHGQVETAVEQWLATADVFIDTRGDPVTGSWSRRMAASLKRTVKSPAAQEALLTATHIADSHLVQAQDAYVTATLLYNVGPVLQALQPTKDAVVRAGALLIVKVDGAVQVHQLTAAQQAILDHRPHLAVSPKEIIAALELPDTTTTAAS